MPNTQQTAIDIECGGGEIRHHHLRSSTSDDNPCFSDVEEEEEEGSCYSQFYSTYGSDDPEIGHLSTRISSAASDCSVDAVTPGDAGVKVVILHLEKKKVADRDCRICHLSLVDDGEDDDDAIELGCCCKDDLAAAHKHCAETWFKIKGNKICEICNSIVSNLVVPNETPSTHGTIDVNPAATSVATTRMSTAIRGRGCINGHRLLNFILACLVFAFVISWLFHFNIPS